MRKLHKLFQLWNWITETIQVHRRWVWVAVGVLVVLSAGGIYFLRAATTQAAPEQPIAFPHKVMVQAGVPCLFCHANATRAPVAGIPSVEKCMGCHKFIATSSPEIKKLTGYRERGESIPWVRVNRLPRFVYFTHEVHVTKAGLNCERCHGDVGQMQETYAPVKFTMGYCLSCHEQQPNAPQLMECITCHR